MVAGFTSFSAQLADKYGRLFTTRLSLIGAALGHAIQSVSYFPICWWLPWPSRFIAGYSNAIFLVACVTYISEISPLTIRGKLSVTLGLGFNLGAVLGGTLGMEVVLGK